jgi:hypothetical protein
MPPLYPRHCSLQISLARLRALPEVIQFFKDFHRIYVDTVMNPFYIPDERIESRKFERRLQQLVNSFGKSEGK